METGNFPQTTGKCSTLNKEKMCAEQVSATAVADVAAAIRNHGKLPII
jgi:hypothetical protein